MTFVVVTDIVLVTAALLGILGADVRAMTCPTPKPGASLRASSRPGTVPDLPRRRQLRRTESAPHDMRPRDSWPLPR